MYQSNQTRLKRLRGNVIKQGDTSSVFKYELRPIAGNSNQLNGTAKVELISEDKAKYSLTSEVVGGVIEFTLSDILPVGDYLLEVEHAGYVFPSSDEEYITVNENVENYLDGEVKTLYKLDDLPSPEELDELKDIIEQSKQLPSDDGLDPLAAYNLAKI